MSIRRQARPDLFWRIWMGLKNINQQKLIPDAYQLHEHIPAHLNITQEQLSAHLCAAVAENLLLSEEITVDKGPRKGQKINIYIIPEFLEKSFTDNYDWYCYQCHLGGEVVFCGSCTRVFHLSCHTDNITRYRSNDAVNKTPSNGDQTILLNDSIVDLGDSVCNENTCEIELNKNLHQEVKNGIEHLTETNFDSPTISKILKNERESFEVDRKVIKIFVYLICLILVSK